VSEENQARLALTHRVVSRRWKPVCPRFVIRLRSRSMNESKRDRVYCAKALLEMLDEPAAVIRAEKS